MLGSCPFSTPKKIEKNFSGFITEVRTVIKKGQNKKKVNTE